MNSRYYKSNLRSLHMYEDISLYFIADLSFSLSLSFNLIKSNILYASVVRWDIVEEDIDCISGSSYVTQK